MIVTPNSILNRFCLMMVLYFSFPHFVEGFDSSLEGRAVLGSSYVFDTPSDLNDFDSEAEIRIGVLGNVWANEDWEFDYELSADAKQAKGPSVQSHLRQETDIDFFRAWLRLDNGEFKLRGGRQKIHSRN